MKRSLLLAALAGLSFACATTSKPTLKSAVAVEAVQPITTLSRKDVARKVVPASVRVFLDSKGQVRRSGTGVVIAREITSTGGGSYILTNAHVIDDRGVEEPRVRVIVEHGPDSFEYDAQFVAAGTIPEMDLALLKLPGVLLEPVELALDSEVETGDDVLVVASPFDRGLTLSGGMVSQVEWDPATRTPKTIKTDAAVGYGSSGGGVFSVTTGKLLGIVEGYRTTRVGFAIAQQDFSFDLPMPGETFAAPAAKVRRFIGDKGFAHLISVDRELRYSSTSTH